MEKRSIVGALPVLGIFGFWLFAVLANLAFWGFIAYVVLHFVLKFW